MAKWKAGFLGLIAVGCVLWLSGCLAQEITTVVRYDRKGDVFAVFTVYEHFRSNRSGTATPAANKNPTPAEYAQGDLGKLKDIWEGRDRLLPLGPVSLDGPLKTFLTLDRHGLSAEPKSKTSDWPPGEPTVSWEKLQIIPGKLFEDQNGMIGYWHEVRIPGSVVDELLAFARVQLRKNADLIELLDVEAEDRHVGKDLGQWADVSAWVKKKIESAGKDDGSKEGSLEFERRILNCFETRSLAAVDKAIRKGEFELSRSGETIRLKLALTRRDAEGLASVMRQVNTSLIELEKDNAEQRENSKLAFVIRAAVEASGKLSADENGFAIEMNSVALLNNLFSAAGEEQARIFAADTKAKVDAAAMAKEVKDWQGGTIEKGVEVKKLLTEFNARKLDAGGP